MKKQAIITAAIAVTALAACKKDETTISVNLTDMPEGTIVEIYRQEGRVGTPVFTDTILNGSFNHTYVCDSFDINTYYSVDICNDNFFSGRDVYISPNTSSAVSGSGTNTYKWTVTSKNPHQQFSNNINDAYIDVIDEMGKLEAKLQDSEQTPEERQMLQQSYDSIRNVYNNLSISTLAKLPVDEYWMEMFDMMTMSVRHFGSAHPKYAEFVELYNRMSDADKATPAGKRITLSINGKTLAVGDKYIDCDLFDVEGNSHHLAEYQGKWMLLEFSSSSCGPCRMLTPVIRYFYDIGVGKNLEIITLTEDPKDIYKEMVATDKPANPLWNNQDLTLFPTYKIAGLPTFYLISPDGTIAGRWDGLDLQRIVDAIITAGAFPKPEYRTENGATIIANPTFTSSNHVILVGEVELYADSTVLNCTHPSAINFAIKPETHLTANNKEISILKSNDGREKVIQSFSGDIGQYRITFGPLPKGVTEFDFVQDNCEECFRVMGVKVKE